MSALGRGLLSGFAGAAQGAEQFIQQERKMDHEMTLTELREKRAMEREMLRKEYTTDMANQSAAISVHNTQVTQKGYTDRAQIAADTREKELQAMADKEEARRLTATDRNNMFTNVIPTLMETFPELYQSEEMLDLNKNPDADTVKAAIIALSRIATESVETDPAKASKARLAIQELQRFNNIEGHEAAVQWQTMFSDMFRPERWQSATPAPDTTGSAGVVATPANDPLGLRTPK